MIKTFVLYVMMSTASASGGMTMTSHEFPTIEQCQSAGKQVTKEMSSWFTSGRYTCVPKETPIR